MKSSHSILLDVLGKCSFSERLVPRMLTPEKKVMRVSIAGDVIDTADKDNKFLNNIITGDETWSFL